MDNEMTLARAREVIQAWHDAERAKKREALLPLVGKFFKYRNSYGSGSAGWWLYGYVTGVDKIGMCLGWTFQRDDNGRIEIEPNGPSTITIRAEGSGWVEISATEFWREAAGVSLAVVKQLARRPVRTVRRRQSGA